MTKGQRTGLASGAALFLFAALAAPAPASDPLDTNVYEGRWRVDSTDVEGYAVAEIVGQPVCAPIDDVLAQGGQLVEIERASRDLIRMTVTRRSASGGRALDGPFIVSIANENGRVVMTLPGRRDEVVWDGPDSFSLWPLTDADGKIFRRCN